MYISELKEIAKTCIDVIKKKRYKTRNPRGEMSLLERLFKLIRGG